MSNLIPERSRNVMKLIFGRLLDECRENEWVTFYRVFDDSFDFMVGVRTDGSRLSVQQMISIKHIETLRMSDADFAQMKVEELFNALRRDPRY